MPLLESGMKARACSSFRSGFLLTRGGEESCPWFSNPIVTDCLSGDVAVRLNVSSLSVVKVSEPIGDVPERLIREGNLERGATAWVEAVNPAIKSAPKARERLRRPFEKHRRRRLGSGSMVAKMRVTISSAGALGKWAQRRPMRVVSTSRCHG
ncbi:MAG: hypothetical protein M2R45_04207 [Verrucomicrobia subdivision 3 bacterium]|nr:hypothetical protein [Limisphaerales bacterium]MCS1417056.1 hypothetical protein [Limisphaerales bacterium]